MFSKLFSIVDIFPQLFLFFFRIYSLFQRRCTIDPFKFDRFHKSSCQRPYHVEYTSSRPITEVKQRRAWSVLGWVTAWEHHVLLASIHFFLLIFPIRV
jgi:hypothetical protein